MRVKLITDFIANNTIEEIKEYNDLLLDKLKQITDLHNKVSFIMILLIVIYIFFQDSAIKGVDVSFMKIEKFEIIAQFIPPLFCLVFLCFTIINTHRAELIQFSRILIYEIFHNTIESKSSVVDNEVNTFARIIQPFSGWLETQKWDVNGKASPIDALLRLPLILVTIFFPFVFIFYSLKMLYIHYWDSPFSKYAFVFSIWITIYIIYTLMRIMKVNYKWSLEQ